MKSEQVMAQSDSASSTTQSDAGSVTHEVEKYLQDRRYHWYLKHKIPESAVIWYELNKDVTDEAIKPKNVAERGRQYRTAKLNRKEIDACEATLFDTSKPHPQTTNAEITSDIRKRIKHLARNAIKDSKAKRKGKPVARRRKLREEPNQRQITEFFKTASVQSNTTDNDTSDSFSIVSQ